MSIYGFAAHFIEYEGALRDLKDLEASIITGKVNWGMQPCRFFIIEPFF
jgi:hypothetical protein